MNKHTLVIGPSRNTIGGITTVINAYLETTYWTKWNCLWIESYRNSSKKIKIYYFIRAFILYLIKLPYSQIVHIHFSWATSAIRKFPFFITAKIFNKTIIIHLHAGDEDILNSKYQFIYKYFFLHADKTILLAENIKNKLSSHYNIKSAIVIHNPCPKININKQIKKNKYILFIGAINQLKGYCDLIEAFSFIAKKFPKWKLVFAGNGEIERAKKLVNKFDIENQVIFKGWVSNNEKESLYRESSFLCLPSYSEGFPMAVIEAWAYGLPVIATSVGGLTSVLEHNKNALVYKPGDLDSLCSNIELLINDDVLRNRLSTASFQLSINEFNVEKIIDQLDDLYLNLL